MTVYVEQVGLGELIVHSSQNCSSIKFLSALTTNDVAASSPGEAAVVVRREAGLASVRACGVCGYRSSGTGDYTGGGGHMGAEEEEPLQG